MYLKGIKAKILAGALVLVTVPLAVVGVYAVNKAGGDIERSAMQGAGNTSSHLSMMVEMSLRSTMDMVSQMASRKSVTAAARLVAADGVTVPRAEVQDLSRQFTKWAEGAADGMIMVTAFDAAGTVFADSNGGGLRGVSISSADYYGGSRKGPFVSRVRPGEKGGKPVVTLAVPLFDMDQKYLGGLAMTLAMSRFTGFIDSTKLGQSGYTFMVDKDGRVIAHPSKEVELKLNLCEFAGMNAIAAKMLAGDQGVEEYVFRGTEKVAAFAPIPIAGWSLAATQNWDELMSTARSISMGILIICLGALLAALAACLLLVNRIVNPVRRAADRMAQASSTVGSTSEQLLGASHELAESSCEQAASLEETTAALEEMASMIQNTAANTNHADELMGRAAGSVEEAQEAMSALAESMGLIGEAGGRIGSIVRSIEKIAFQTNLLALNAAVEAARAGEAGNGFAVVADEVRSLAMNAGESVKETKMLVQTTSERIQSGTEVLSSTMQSFENVGRSVEQAAALLAEIKASAGDQAVGVSQVHQAMRQIDQAVSSNSAAAEESSAASAQLESQARDLKATASGLLASVVGRVDSGGNGNGHHSGQARRRGPSKALPAALPLLDSRDA